MSGEQLTDIKSVEKEVENKTSNTKAKVDINVLLNRVRTDKKKERYENIIFVSLLYIPQLYYITSRLVCHSCNWLLVILFFVCWL